MNNAKTAVRIIMTFLTLPLAAALLIGISSCNRTDSPKKADAATSPASAVKNTALPFKLKTFDGKDFSLEDKRGRVVVVNFFASWCPPCKLEAPAIEKTYAAFKDSGVDFIGVAVDDSDEAVRGFVKENHITFPAGLDVTGDIMKAYNIAGVPKTYIVGRDGRVLFTHSGAITEEELTKEIKLAI